jgi:hypothetical protein
MAYAFLNAPTLDEEQLNDLEAIIKEAGDPLTCARRWAEENQGAVRPWSRPRRTRGSSVKTGAGTENRAKGTLLVFAFSRFLRVTSL